MLNKIPPIFGFLKQNDAPMLFKTITAISEKIGTRNGTKAPNANALAKMYAIKIYPASTAQQTAPTIPKTKAISLWVMITNNKNFCNKITIFLTVYMFKHHTTQKQL